MELINAPGAPAAIGPYSHAVKAGDLLFVSGQVPFDPATGDVVGADISTQTAQALSNLDKVLAHVGLNKNNIAKATVFLSDYDDFAEFNKAYAAYMGEHRPARTTVEVGRLPKNVRVEIDVIASFK